jgi:hypothetical protein
VTEPCCAYCMGQVFAHARRVSLGERIILPLGDDGARATGSSVRPCTIRGRTTGRRGAEPVTGETVAFYELP